ncbi:MAG: fibronectin type III domain-containing protein [Bacteroidetes bacterium]|nr:fibronectin type III domain-containing protein [Bacteroidota bacterium]
MNYFAKTDLRNKNAIEVYFKANKVSKRMANNPNFPGIIPSRDALVLSVLSLREALSKEDGSKISISKRNTAHKQVAKDFTNLSHYITCVSKGDPNIILSSGYDLNTRNKVVTITERPLIYRKTKINQYGLVKLKWTPITKAKWYTIFLYDFDQPKVVLRKFHSSKSSLTLDGLESGKKYFVSVQAHGRRNKGPMGPVVIVAEMWG